MTRDKGREGLEGGLSAFSASAGALRVSLNKGGSPADTEAMARLRTSLDDLVQRPSSAEAADAEIADAEINVPRASAIALLECLTGFLQEQLRVHFEAQDDGTDVFLEHPAVSLLWEFVGALRDLDNAKTHDFFKTPNPSKGASITSAERRRRLAWLELVTIVQSMNNLSTRASAEREVAKMMEKTVGRKTAIKASRFREWRKTLRRRPTGGR